MQTIDEYDRQAFDAIAGNSFIEYTEAENARLKEIAVELRRITKAANDRLRKAS